MLAIESLSVEFGGLKALESIGFSVKDGDIVGIATDAVVETTLPMAHLDDVEAVASLMQRSAISVEEVLARSLSES